MLDARLLHPRLHRDRPILSELDGVGEQIHAHLLHSLLVALNKLFGQLSNNLDFLAGSLHLDHSDNLHDALLDLHVYWLHLERTALDLGMVQGVVNVV